MDQPAIDIRHFNKRYGSRNAVSDLTLQVPRGSVFGLLGQNGAGKSTTIKTLLNLLQPTSGSLRVLGLDTRGDAVEIRRRVGYLPEEPAYYKWMTVEEIVRFNAAFFPRWDGKLSDSLLRRLDLPLGRKLGALSRGMQAKVGLVMALGCRPELLILDDPTSGLDPVVRHEFLEAMIANVQADGGTVFFSTHLLHEMERVADEVAILHKGELIVRDSLERLKRRTKKLRVVYGDSVPERLEFSFDTLRVQRNTHQLLLTVPDYRETLHAELHRDGAESIEVIDLSLEEVFVEAVKGRGGATDG